MSTLRQYDAIIIGSGQAGTPLSVALANAGMRTVLIERKHVGGTCVNEGCTPSKTMVASARLAYLARRAADYGVYTGDIRVNMERVRQRKRDIVTSFRSGSQRRRADPTDGRRAPTLAAAATANATDHPEQGGVGAGVVDALRAGCFAAGGRNGHGRR